MNAKRSSTRRAKQAGPAKHQRAERRHNHARPAKATSAEQLSFDRGADFEWRQAPTAERESLLAALRAKRTVEHSAAADVLSPNAESFLGVTLGWRVVPRDRRQAVVTELAEGESDVHVAASALLGQTSIAGFSAVPEWLEAMLAALQAIHDGLDPTDARDAMLRGRQEAQDP